MTKPNRGSQQASLILAAVGCAVMWSLRNMADTDKRAAVRKIEEHKKHDRLRRMSTHRVAWLFFMPYKFN